MNFRGRIYYAIVALLLVSQFGVSLRAEAGQVNASAAYVVFAWNDLGMHCLNPTYDRAVILPPYNNLIAQVVKRGNPPIVTTAGLTVEYRVLNNTYSAGKRNYGQFWQYMQELFGVSLPVDKGLNLVDPNIHNGLSGSMVVHGSRFEADGIPVTPVDDAGVWNPFQAAEITVKDATGNIVAQTITTIPTSDEINCGKCHGADPIQDILSKHDQMHGTSLAGRTGVLCASCHAAPELGVMQPHNGAKGYLSSAMHGSHSTRGATCYDCHPGDKTRCNRSIYHADTDGGCQYCHGDMKWVADTAKNGWRTPWVDEPKCVMCHQGVAQVDTGAVLYRNAIGHGGLGCPACHGSPHAMVPAREYTDNYQSVQYQGAVVPIGSCGACHATSKGEGSGDFPGKHGGTRPETASACSVCHTGISGAATVANWPHRFQWKARINTNPSVSGD